MYKVMAQSPLFAELQAGALEMMEAGYVAASLKTRDAAMRAFEYFCGEYKVTRPVMILEAEVAGDLRASCHNELSLMYFAYWLLTCGYAATTCGNYVSLAKNKISSDLGYHIVATGASVRLPKMLRAIRRLHGGVRRQRRGWRAHHMVALRAILGDSVSHGDLVDEVLLNGMRAGLLRGREVGPSKASEFDGTRDPLWGDVTFESLPEPHMVWHVYPAKKAAGCNTKVPVLFPADSGPCSTYESMWRMRAAREALEGGPVHPEAPLLISAWGKGGVAIPVTTQYVRSTFKRAAKAIGIDPRLVGAHSGRIGGATDHFAMGTPPIEIQVLGRWDSDIWQIYARQCVGRSLRFTEAAARCDDVDLEEARPGYAQPARVTRA